jgi:hypothetical protein
MNRIILFVAVVLSSLSFAQRTAIAPVKGINLGPGEAEVIGELLAQAYAKASRIDVISPSSVASAMAGADVVTAAHKLGAKEMVEATALGLESRKGKSYRISVTRRRAGGELIHQAEMSASSMEDVVVVSGRLAEALVQKVDPTAARNRNTVAASESGLANRLRSESILGVKAVFIQPVGNVAFVPMGGISFDARLEREKYFLEFGVGFLIPGPVGTSRVSSYGGITTEIGANYFLTDGDVGVYAGGGLQTRAISSNGLAFNLAPFAQLGVTFSRDSSTRFFADLRVAQNVLPIGNNARFANDPTPSQGYPTEIGAQVGIGF